MKKMTSIMLAASILFSQSIVISAEESEQKPISANIYDRYDIMQTEDDFAERFIVKYKSQALLSADMEISEETMISDAEQAFVKAERAKILKSEHISDTGQSMMAESGLLKMETNISNNPKTGIMVNELKTEYLIFDLGEKVDTETFMEEMKKNSNIEYIQPDYELKFASEENMPGIGTEIEEIPSGVSPTFVPEESIIPELTVLPDLPAEESTLPEGSEQTEKTPVPDNNGEGLPDQSPAEEQIITEGSVSCPKIALIDGGVDVTHEVFAGKITDAWDFVNDTGLVYDAAVSDQYYHGTHVAGIIANTAPNAEIMPLKVFEHGTAYTSDIIDAIGYAEEHGAEIVNCSWGSADNNRALKDVIEASEMLFICAVGNNRVNLEETPMYPACYDLDNIISVTSVNSDSGLSYFSNYSNVDIAACGRDILSACPENQYGEMNGTSMSAAFVSGAAAIANGENIYEKRQNIIDTADKVEHLRAYVDGGRMLNLDNLKENIQSSGYIEKEYIENFNLEGYNRTPSENWELFNSLQNVQVEAGNAHIMVLKSDGTVWTWGGNFDGQLGINKSQCGTPIQIPWLQDIISISVGYSHSIALKVDGTVYTWGYNNRGQLGNGTTTNSNMPMQVVGLTNIKEIAAGNYHSMALHQDGTLFSWGSNPNGELGDGTNVNKSVPIHVEGLTNVKTMNGGEGHSLAVTDNGDVFSWGYNNRGQLGDGTLTKKLVPNQVVGLSNIKKVVCGYAHSVALEEDGKVFSWGRGGSGQLGNGSTQTKKTPDIITGLENVIDITAGIACTIIVNEEGNVYKAGSAEIGSAGPNEFQIITGFQDVKNIDINSYHMVALTNAGEVYTWGSNRFGQLGDGVNIPQLTARKVEGLNNVTKICGGSEQIFALTADRTVYSWGDNNYEVLGYKSADTSVPHQIPGLNDVISIDAGWYYCIALRADGTVYSWGNDKFHSLSTPTQIQNLTDVISVSAGIEHCIALKNDGTVWAWGDNEGGQLGDGTTNQSLVPVQVTGLTDVTAISAGSYYNLALKADGTVYAWGRNGSYQLGDGTKVDKHTPVLVKGLSDIASIATGESHSLVLKTDGTVYAWGANSFGALGLGDSYSRTTPSKITGISDVKEIDANVYFSIALKEDGTVYSWGTNHQYGQLGDGTVIDKNIPVQVIGLNNIKSVSLGRYNGMAINENGEIYVWGHNQYGQVGDRHELYRSIPYHVSYSNDLEQENTGFETAEKINESEAHNGYIREANQSLWYYLIPKRKGNYSISLSTGYTVTAYSEDMNEIMISTNELYLSYPNKVYLKISKNDSQTGEFAIDISPENPISNYQEFAIVVGSDEYYSNLFDGGKLYKNSTAITDEAVRWICKSGSTIYYAKDNSVCKLSSEGTEVVVQNNIIAHFLTADTEKLYFANWSDGGKIYSYNLQTAELTKMCEDIGTWLEVRDGYLYYNNSMNRGARYKIPITAVGLSNGERV